MYTVGSEIKKNSCILLSVRTLTDLFQRHSIQAWIDFSLLLVFISPGSYLAAFCFTRDLRVVWVVVFLLKNKPET